MIKKISNSILIFIFIVINSGTISCLQKSNKNDLTKEEQINQAGNSAALLQDESDDSIPKSVKNDYTDLGFELMAAENLGDLKLNMPLQEIFRLLGEPEEKSSSELWGADGEYHQTYTYSKQGIELDITGEKDSEKRINMITITAPCTFKTLKEIGIGSTWKDVNSAYNKFIDPVLTDSFTMVIGSIYGGIIVGFDDKGSVSSIFIGAAAE